MTMKRHLKSLLSLTASGFVAFGASEALAQQQQGCPPGSWFCADAQVQPAAPAGQPVAPTTQLQPLPPQGQVQAQPPPAVVYQQAPAPPPVVVYQPAPPPVVVVRPTHQEYGYRYYYRAQRPSGPPYRQSEWGLNLRFDGAAFGSGKVNGDSGMGGVGLGLRFKPTPYFGIEAGADFLFGRDYNSFRRSESGLSLSGLLYLNPRSRAQVYLLGGINWSTAKVTDDVTNPYFENQYTYNYFGGQFGLGIEFRLSRVIALNMDVRGVIRGRTDDAAKTQPEFTDASGRTTNTSGGAVITGGLTFYF